MVKIVDDRNGMNGVCENGDDGCSVFNNLYIERTTLSERCVHGQCFCVLNHRFGNASTDVGGKFFLFVLISLRGNPS
uniref:Uncharacterized protein n=1 Tax=Helianthus annuus TaxID=4232 RepID=A0A251VDJ0_HELAN